jgi:hypothetical protein
MISLATYCRLQSLSAQVQTVISQEIQLAVSVDSRVLTVVSNVPLAAVARGTRMAGDVVVVIAALAVEAAVAAVAAEVVQVAAAGAAGSEAE